MQVKLTGIKDLEKALEKMPKELADSASKSVLRYAMKPALDKAKGLAPSESGALRKALGINVRKNKRGPLRGQISARMGARSGFAAEYQGKRRDPVRYSHLIEFGTAKKPARSFIRASVESSKDEMNSRIAKGYGMALKRIVKRIRK